MGKSPYEYLLIQAKQRWLYRMYGSFKGDITMASIHWLLLVSIVIACMALVSCNICSQRYSDSQTTVKGVTYKLRYAQT